MRCSALVSHSKQLRLERHDVAYVLNDLLELALFPVQSACNAALHSAFLLMRLLCRCDEGGHCTDVCKRGSVQIDEWLQHSIQTQVCLGQCCNYRLRAA